MVILHRAGCVPLYACYCCRYFANVAAVAVSVMSDLTTTATDSLVLGMNVSAPHSSSFWRAPAIESSFPSTDSDMAMALKIPPGTHHRTHL
jgi:hypothetical protein